VIYDQLVKDDENILKNRMWSGTTLVTLPQHMGLHCKAYITLTECAEHIPVEISNDWEQVTYLLDSFKMIDPSVLAAMASVRQDDADKRINFENAFTFLAPSCPVVAKAAKEGRVSYEANVSGTGGKPQQGGLGGDHEKPGKGATGVALCSHKFEEYRNLSKEKQKNRQNLMESKTEARVIFPGAHQDWISPDVVGMEALLHQVQAVGVVVMTSSVEI
jgi:hypothetical protein